MIAHRDHQAAEEPRPSFLAAAIGNTMTRLACMDEASIVLRREVRTEDAQALRNSLAELRDQFAGTAPAVVASVVPVALRRLRLLCAELSIRPVLAIGDEIALPIHVALEHPEKVGVDRICCAAAAYARSRAAAVVADFGTALTVDLVADDGAFMGGTILPGLQLAARALGEHTALLPLVEVKLPGEVVGRDTEAAIRAGVFYGLVGALREITERIATLLGKWPTLIITGGDASAIAAAGGFVDVVAPDLIFEGIAFAYARHVRRADA